MNSDLQHSKIAVSEYFIRVNASAPAFWAQWIFASEEMSQEILSCWRIHKNLAQRLPRSPVFGAEKRGKRFDDSGAPRENFAQG